MDPDNRIFNFKNNSSRLKLVITQKLFKEFEYFLLLMRSLYRIVRTNNLRSNKRDFVFVETETQKASRITNDFINGEKNSAETLPTGNSPIL